MDTGQATPRGSRGFVIGVCLASFCLTLGLVSAGILVKQAASRHVEVSPAHRVFYNKQAGPDEARKVGEILEAHGVFVPGERAEVDYSHYRQSVTLEVTLDRGWHDPAVMKLYTEIANELATETKERFVKIHLLDRGGKVKQKVEISRASAP